MSETLSGKSFNPIHMADLLRKKREAATSPESERDAKAVGPVEGAEIEINGEKLRWSKVSTGNRVWNSETQRLEPGYHSLRTWFSHHTDGVGMGPGWDGRYRLADLTPQEQVKRYNHTFTHEEISAPSGSRNLETGQLEGGMPVDVPYLELEPVDEAKRELPENN